MMRFFPIKQIRSATALTTFLVYADPLSFLPSPLDPFFPSPSKIGILSADGESWKFQRKQATHLFNVNAFREYTSEVFNKEAQKVLEYLGKAADSGSIVDFHAIMHAFTLDVFGR